jgi:hypothetical protein
MGLCKDNRDNIYLATWNVNDSKGDCLNISNNKLTDITRQSNITSTSLWCLLYDEETSNCGWVLMIKEFLK